MTDTYRALIEELKQESAPYAPGSQPRPPGRPYPSILDDAASALEVLSNPAIHDGAHYRSAQERTQTAVAEYNSASRGVDLARIKERCAELMSQHEPLAGLGLDREKVRQVLLYVQTGRLK